METTTTQTTTTISANTQTQTTQTTQSIDWMFQDMYEDDFDLIEFGIASNGGRLSITQRKL